MINVGENEITGIFLGDNEIAGIYAGDELLYPTTVSGFTVSPLELVFAMQGGSKRIKITSEYSWTASVSDSGITLSAYSGGSGRTTIDVVMERNETGAEITGNITISSSESQDSATVGIIQVDTLIPSEFQEIEYINEPKNRYAYIPTNIYMNSDMWFEFKVSAVENPATPEKHFFSGNYYQAARVLANYKARFGRGDDSTITPSNNVYGSFPTGDKTFVLYKNNDNVVVNGTTITTLSPGRTFDTQPGWFFSWKETIPTSSVNLSPVCNFYYMIIGSNTSGEELYHFIPVRRIADNEVGLFDIVNGVFYGPGNSNKFVAGPDVVHTPTVVLKIGGQSITGVLTNNYYYWDGLDQYEATSFTIEEDGVPIVASEAINTEQVIDVCSSMEETAYTYTNISTFQSNPYHYIIDVQYNPSNSVYYTSIVDDSDPQRCCEEVQGGCWDGSSCADCGGSGTDPVDCSDYETLGYTSYEDCDCAENSNCPEEGCNGDPECECVENGGTWDGSDCIYE